MTAKRITKRTGWTPLTERRRVHSLGRRRHRLWRTRAADRCEIVRSRLQSGRRTWSTGAALYDRSCGQDIPERPRVRAKVILGAVARTATIQRTRRPGTWSCRPSRLGDRFMADHVRAKRKAGTAEFYRDIVERIVKPALGTTKADKLSRLQVGRLHSSLADHAVSANRMLAVVGSMYAFAGRTGIVPEGINPGARIDKFTKSRRERFLTGEELERLGTAIREAEAVGIRGTVDPVKPTAKHVPKTNRTADLYLFGSGSAAASVHRLPPAGNPASAVGTRRY